MLRGSLLVAWHLGIFELNSVIVESTLRFSSSSALSKANFCVLSVIRKRRGDKILSPFIVLVGWAAPTKRWDLKVVGRAHPTKLASGHF
jgi:hypothetical protein